MKELTVEAIVEQIETVTEFVNAELEKLDCPMKARIQLDIAIDEIVSNIAYYAYGEKTGTVTVRIEALPGNPDQTVCHHPPGLSLYFPRNSKYIASFLTIFNFT